MNTFWEHLLNQRWTEALLHVASWAVGPGLRILVIVALIILGGKIARAVIGRVLHIGMRPHPTEPLRDLSIAKRRNTLTQLLHRVVSASLLAVGALMIFRELNFEIGPILASAGVVGIAVGFGAQSLVKDIISGAFVIFENQFDVGDIIRVGTTSGLVEAINLRTIIIRDVEGTVHIIPNGEVSRVSVLTKDWSRFVLDVDVAYHENVDRVTEVLRGVLTTYATENRELLLGEPEILGLDALADSSIKIRALIKTIPGKQWEVGRAVRRAVKNEFDRAGIEIPFPQRTVWTRSADEQPPLPVSTKKARE